MNDKIRRVKRLLKVHPTVEFAYLFGSRSRGSAGARSDWDIAIFFNKDPQQLPQWTVFYLEAEIAREVGNEVQIIVLNSLDMPVLLFQVISNGSILVDNNTKHRILFESRVLSRYHDWQYFLRRHVGASQHRSPNK
jgi:hypothetical protein